MHRLRPIPFLSAATAGIALGALTCLGAATAGAATPANSAQAEYKAAMNSVGSQGVHFSSNASQQGATITVVGDTGTSSGAETIVVKKGNLTEQMHAMVIGSTAYLNGNSAALQRVLGLKSATASKYAGTWLSFPAKTNGLSSLVAGLLNSQVGNEMRMDGPYHYGSSATVGGQKALAIKGTVRTQDGSSVPVVLYVPASGTPFPLEEVTNPGNSGGANAVHGAVTFTKWGQQTNQRVPTHTVALIPLLQKSSGSSSSAGNG